ncbi:DoxX family protein [candidate division KSB1 bacterium]|nr:DoxX family protein [candidate division KSB1 bacterium]
MELTKNQAILSWILQVITAVILLQTLFFKFTGAQESVYIFTTLGIEPWGRIGSGVVELIAAVLLLIPSTVTFGAILALGTITVAILSHLTKLGIALPAVNDRGELFALAVVVFVCSLVVLIIRRQQIPIIGPSFA